MEPVLLPGASALIVGEGGFAAQSLEKIEKVAEVVAVATRDPRLTQMAEERGLPVLRGRKAIERFVAERTVDYLFSVDNPIVLNAAILGRVNKLAANWHDSPLPAYGGLNATSWAIAAGEKMHASVLHEVREGIDDGDIYVWRDVPIASDDTAAVLNAKCFDAGLDALDELLSRIVSDSVEATPQRGTPSYFGFDAVPPNAALLDPSGSAKSFERWSRALDLGPAVNRLASVRVLAEVGGERVLRLPRRVRFGEVKLGVGETRRQGASWLVGCQDGTLELSDFRRPDGTPTEPPDAILSPSPEFMEACVAGCASLSRHESYWMGRLQAPRLDWALPLAAPGESARIALPIERGAAPAAFAAYLLQTRRERAAVIGLRVKTDERFFSGSVPLRLPALGERDMSAYLAAFDKELARVDKRGTYTLDASARWRLRPPLPWKIEIAIDRAPDAQADLALQIEGDACFIASPSGRYALELRRVQAQLSLLAKAPGPLSSARYMTERDLARDARGLVGGPLARDERTVAARIADIAERMPDQIAVRSQAESYSYERLMSDVARVVGQLDVRAGARVALHAMAPYPTVVASLASLFRGAAYVPLGGDASRARIVLAEAKVDCEISSDWMTNALTREAPALPPGPTPEDPAYVIFTSGTTGRPKGVVISHANLSAQLDSRVAGYGNAPTRFLSLHSPSFDSFVAGFYWTLCAGDTLVLATEEERHDPFDVARLIRARAITHLDVPPALYSELLSMDELDMSSVEVVIVGGEACPPQLARRHHERASHARFYNEYGPTEATVFATLYDVPADTGIPVPIGRPIAGVDACVVNPDLRPLPPGFVGELIVAGPTVASGYFERPDQTAERFVPDPRSGGPAYRTGDHVRLNAEDQLEWLGRIDGQVQVRGYRVELSGIETALEALAGVSQAAASLVKLGPVKKLCAFVVGENTDGGRERLDVARLRAELSDALPSYSVPDHIEQVGHIPRTSAGKIDRSALRPSELPPPVSESVPPKGTPAGLIASLMGEVLGRGPLGADASFFDSGGNSFLAIRLVRRIEEASGERVPIVDLFRSPTPSGLVARMSTDQADAPRYLDLIQEREEGGLVVFVGSPAQARALAQHLEWGVTGLNVFGLPDAWIETGELHVIAEEFCSELTPHCGDRPVVLTGFCHDTKVAAEMYPRLIKAGVDVRAFVAIDGGWMLGEGLESARGDRIVRALKAAISSDRRMLLRDARARIQTLMDDIKVRMGKKDYQTDTPGGLARDQALARTYLDAQSSYQRRFEEDVIVLLSRTYRATTVPPNIDLRVLPVDHATLFLEPQVEELAVTMRSLLRESFGPPGR